MASGTGNAPASLKNSLTRKSLSDPDWKPPDWLFTVNGEELDLYEFRPPEEEIVCNYDNAYDFPRRDLVGLAQTFHLISLGKAQITTKQFKKVLQLEGEIPTEKEWEQIKEFVDPEAKGWYTFQQLLDALKSPWIKREVLTEAQLEECFASIDADRSGSVTCAELKHILSTLGDGLSESEANEMIAEADASGDGEIDYVEFAQTILSTQ